jgi:nicotinamide-nucleotide amidase
MDALSPILVAKAGDVLDLCERTHTRLATAESCTGGLVGASLTAIPGSSAWVDRGFITYSNQAKIDLLGIAPALIDRHGVVSEEVARAMAEGAIAHSAADAAVAITGIAGPGGGSPEKPVGLVHIAAARRQGATLHRRLILDGERSDIRLQAALAAMDLLMDRIRTVA